MPYLMIENQGVAPITAFTVLGATTKRDSDIPGLIGTFGSGGNMATLDLLRHDIYPTIYCGKTALNFTTKPLPVDDVSGFRTHHKQVFVKYSGTSTKTEKLSWTTAYGAKDWGNIDFAMREYISNAIDAMLMQGVPLENVGANVAIEIVEDEQVRARDGYTRVFVPATEEVRHFFAHIDSWFLHFSESESLGKEVLPKYGRNITTEKGIPLQRAVIFRRGVRVREFMSDTIPSLYDYNLNDLEMNESRCVDDWVVQNEVGKVLKRSGPDTLVKVLQALIKGSNVWESRLTDYSLSASSGDDIEAIRANWTAALKATAGENAVVVSEDATSAHEQIKRKGYTPVIVPAAFADAARSYNLLTDDKVLTEDDRAGREFFPANETLIATLDKVWAAVEKYGMANGKQKPPCEIFWEHMKAECEHFGFYHPTKHAVCVHRDYCTAPNDSLDLTVIEEVAHHCSGGTDCSKDFQQWLMRFLHVAVLK